MGCVSSSLIGEEDEIGSMGVGHHIVSLTSSTYGLLTSLDPPTPSPPFHLKSPLSQPKSDLEAPSFRFPPHPNHSAFGSENLHPNIPLSKPKSVIPNKCPPKGEDKVVLYTTSLRGVRSTFEACNAVRSTLQALGYSFSERDISMDRGFRDELFKLFSKTHFPPRLFIKGRYIGGAEEVLRLHEEGGLAPLLQGLPRVKPGSVCDGCGDVRFLPCFQCYGSCKLPLLVQEPASVEGDKISSGVSVTLMMRCPHCNENGLVLCPICC